MNKFIKILLISCVTFSLFSGPNEDLLDAARAGDSAGVEAAITAGADINTITTDGWEFTALMWAATNGHTDIVKLLLDRGADIDAVYRDGNNALTLAATNGHANTVKLLLDRGADIDHVSKYGKTVLIETARFWPRSDGNTDTVKLLLDRGADINAVDTSGNTALIFAAEYAPIDTVKLLLKMGANIDHVNRDRDTALMVAQGKGRTEIAKILQETPKIKPLVDNAIQGDSSAHQKLIEKIKDLNINSYEFNLILNRLINKIKDVGINRNSRKLLLDLAYHIAINLGSAVIGLLPEDILGPMLRGFFPDTDLEYEFDMMNLDAHNQPIKKNLLEIVYAFYKKIEKLEEKATKIRERKLSKQCNLM